MPSVSLLKFGAPLFGISILLGCAGAGPDLNGPDGPNLMAAYSGDWVLDRDESDDLDQKMRVAMRGPGGGMADGGKISGRLPTSRIADIGS